MRSCIGVFDTKATVIDHFLSIKKVFRKKNLYVCTVLPINKTVLVNWEKKLGY